MMCQRILYSDSFVSIRKQVFTTFFVTLLFFQYLRMRKENDEKKIECGDSLTITIFGNTDAITCFSIFEEYIWRNKFENLRIMSNNKNLMINDNSKKQFQVIRAARRSLSYSRNYDDHHNEIYRSLSTSLPEIHDIISRFYFKI